MTKATMLVLAVILFSWGYLRWLHSEAKKRSRMTRKARLELLVECPLGEPKLLEQPRSDRSDQTQVGRGSAVTILRLVLAKVAKLMATRKYQKRSRLTKGDIKRTSSMYLESSHR